MNPYRSPTPPTDPVSPRWGVTEWRKLWCCLVHLRRCKGCGRLRRKTKLVYRTDAFASEESRRYWRCKNEGAWSACFFSMFLKELPCRR